MRRARRIYVFKDGEVAEVGTHRELLAQGGIYANLYEMQFKAQEELEAQPVAPPPGDGYGQPEPERAAIGKPEGRAGGSGGWPWVGGRPGEPGGRPGG
ncbi:MAG: hypothetical protein V1772_07975 [Chloroflexota bacterium]